MTNYLFLLGAIVSEVSGTLLLPASKGLTKVFTSINLILCYLAFFFHPTVAIRSMPLTVAYISWCGLGILLVALFGFLLDGQKLPWTPLLGFAKQAIIEVTMADGAFLLAIGLFKYILPFYFL